MKVRVEIQSISEAMNEGDGAAAGLTV